MRKLSIFLCLIFVLLSVGLVACDGDLVDYSVTISEYPLKTVYLMGEEFDGSGLVVVVKNELTGDSTEVSYGDERLTIVGYDPLTSGKQILTINIADKVTINPASFEIEVEEEYAYSYKESGVKTLEPEIDVSSIRPDGESVEKENAEIFVTLTLDNIDAESDFFSVKCGDVLLDDTTYTLYVERFSSGAEESVTLNYAYKDGAEVKVPLSAILTSTASLELECRLALYRYGVHSSAVTATATYLDGFYYVPVDFDPDTDLKLCYVKIGDVLSIEKIKNYNGVGYAVAIASTLVETPSTVTVYRYGDSAINASLD